MLILLSNLRIIKALDCDWQNATYTLMHSHRYVNEVIYIVIWVLLKLFLNTAVGPRKPYIKLYYKSLIIIAGISVLVIRRPKTTFNQNINNIWSSK